MIRQAPWTVWAFAAIHFMSYAYLASVPGLPEADATTIPWGFIASSALIIILIALGSPSAWWTAVALNVILFPFFLIPLMDTPERFKPWVALVLQGSELALLLSGPTSAHARKRRFTLGEPLVAIALVAVLLVRLSEFG